jgi:hypothetical protein
MAHDPETRSLAEIRRGLTRGRGLDSSLGTKPAAGALEHALTPSKDQVPRRGIRSRVD